MQQDDAAELKGCPFCGTDDPSVIESGDRFYVACASADCFLSLGEIWEPQDTPAHAFETRGAAITAWNTRAPTAQLVEGELRAALKRIDKFVADYLSPWGSWKTPWWEGEVSDDVAFSDDNALRHVATLARTALDRAHAGGEGL